MRSALNASVAFGSLVGVSSSAAFATISCVRTTNLNIKLHVKFWRQRATSASPAISLDSTHVFAARSAIVKTMFAGRVSSTKRTSRSLVLSAILIQAKLRILACQVSLYQFYKFCCLLFSYFMIRWLMFWFILNY